MIGEASYSETEMAYGVTGDDPRMNINPKDYEGLLVRFVLHPHQNPNRSKEEGRPIFEDIPYVDIRTPGDRTSHQFRPACDLDTYKWPEHWRRFKERTESGQEALEGTPLDQWPMITRSLVEELKFFNVRTVEQLANLNDSASQNFMGIQEWKKRAQQYLVALDESKAAEELAAKEARIEDLTSRLEALEEALEKERAANAED